MTSTWKFWRYFRWLYRFLAIAGTFTLSINSALAQSNIVPDNTLDTERSVVTPNAGNFPVEERIYGGAIRGVNLFHSFREFNVSQGNAAYFISPDAIQNILVRVTGSNRSEILGTIGTLGNSSPNLFLINPNGILFGQKARLDVRGSFVGTTANGVQFGNQGVFSATNPEVPVLLTVNPSALFFNQINQNAAIQNNSIAPAGKNLSGGNAVGLRVPDGKSLLLVGGNVSMDGGQLNAFGGRVELGGLTETGTVGLVIDGDNFRLGFPENVTRADVFLTNQARVYVEAAGGGDIAVNARNIQLSEDSIISAGIGERLGKFETLAGDITLNASGDIKFTDLNSKIVNNVRGNSKGNTGNVNVIAIGEILFAGGISSKVEVGGIGTGGDITINSGSLKLQDGAFITTSISGQGDAGNVSVMAKGEISLSGGIILSQVEAGGIGNGGNIDINAAKLSLTNGAQLLTSIKEASNGRLPGKGDAGNILVKITGAVDIAGKKVGADGQDAYSGISSRVNQGAEGNGGDITIDSGSLNLQDRTFVIASTAGQGDAGDVSVMAKGEISLSGGSILSQVEAGGIGNGGNIDIDAAKLSLTNGAQILTSIKEASNRRLPGKGDAGNILVKITGAVDIAGKKVDADGKDAYSGISSRVNQGAEGNGGDITIDSGSLNLQDGTFVTASTEGKGNAGTIKISTDEFLTISGKNSNSTSGLYVNSASQTGTTGDVIVNSPKITIDNQGTVNAESASGNGGNINLNSDLLLLRRGGQITTNAGTAKQGGDGGNINIDSTFIVAVPGENSDITANAFTGKGGQIYITTQGIFGIEPRSQASDATNDITASSQFGIQGQIAIDNPNVDPTRDITPLSEPEPTPIPEGCQGTSTEADFKFTVTGRGGKPLSPSEPLSSNAGWQDLRSPFSSDQDTLNSTSNLNQSTSNQIEIVEAQGWYENSNGEIILTSQPTTVTPYTPWYMPSACVQNTEIVNK